MDFNEWIDRSPLWFIFVFTMALCLVSTELGTRIAAMDLKRTFAKEPDAPLGSQVGALLGLLAFILAFTFGIGSSRFDARRQLVLQESNAVGTTYLRAGMLPATQRSEVRQLLREYVDARLAVKSTNLRETLKTSEAIQTRLWSQAESLVATDMDSEVRSLFIRSLNEMIDLHQSRKTVGTQYRIPGSVWLVVYLLTVLSMLEMGYQVGITGVKRLRGTPVLAAAFSLVILLVADVDRPGEGMIRVSQQPIADVRDMMLQNQP